MFIKLSLFLFLDKTLPLPEDDELQGFLPIDRAFLNLKFDEKSHYQQTDKEDEDNEKNSVTSEQVNSKMTDVLQKHCILKSKSWQSPSPERALLNKKDPNFFNSLRAHRLTHIGEWLSSYLKENGMECLNFRYITLNLIVCVIFFRFYDFFIHF